MFNPDLTRNSRHLPKVEINISNMCKRRLTAKGSTRRSQNIQVLQELIVDFLFEKMINICQNKRSAPPPLKSPKKRPCKLELKDEKKQIFEMSVRSTIIGKYTMRSNAIFPTPCFEQILKHVWLVLIILQTCQDIQGSPDHIISGSKFLNRKEA